MGPHLPALAGKGQIGQRPACNFYSVLKAALSSISKDTGMDQQAYTACLGSAFTSTARRLTFCSTSYVANEQ